MNYEQVLQKYKGLDLIEAVHHHLVQSNYNRSAERNKQKKGIRFYPSSVGQCPRKNVYQMLGYQGKPRDPNDLQVMENGNYFHHRMEDQFEQMGILIARELSLKDAEHAISGRSDAIIWDFIEPVDEPTGEVLTLHDPQGNVVYEGHEDFVRIVEFKSIKEQNYDKLKRVGKSNHIEQLQLYFYLTGIRKGTLYYENKNNQSPKTYHINYDPAIVEKVLNEIKEQVAYAKDGILPDRPYTAIDIPCRYCDFRDICHPDTNPFSYEQLFSKAEKLPF